MKRSELKRKRPLERKTPLRRTSGIPPVNQARRRRLYEENFGDYAGVVRGLPCCVCDAPAPSHPHHVKSRGAGGDRSDLVPLCGRCHTMGHLKGWESFQSRTGVNLRMVADDLWREYGE